MSPPRGHTFLVSCRASYVCRKIHMIRLCQVFVDGQNIHEVTTIAKKHDSLC